MTDNNTTPEPQQHVSGSKTPREAEGEHVGSPLKSPRSLEGGRGMLGALVREEEEDDEMEEEEDNDLSGLRIGMEEEYVEDPEEQKWREMQEVAWENAEVERRAMQAEMANKNATFIGRAGRCTESKDGNAIMDMWQRPIVVQTGEQRCKFCQCMIIHASPRRDSRCWSCAHLLDGSR